MTGHAQAGADVAVLCGEGVAALEALAPRAVAAVITDPPWNLGKDYGGQNDDARSAASYRRWLQRVLRAAVRASRDAVVVLPGSHNLDVTRALVEGLEMPWHRVLQWCPPAASVQPPHTIDIRTEPVLWLRRSPPADASVPATIRVPLESDPYLADHPCPKPVALFRWILERCIQDHGPIFDPFVGSGSSLVAARQLGRAAVGYDTNPSYRHLAARRMTTPVDDRAYRDGDPATPPGDVSRTAPRR